MASTLPSRPPYSDVKPEVDAVHALHVEDRQRVVEVLHVERLEQFESVERHMELVHLAAAHVKAGAVFPRRQAGEPRDGAKQVLAELRARDDLVATQRMRRAARGREQAKGARSDVHRGEARRRRVGAQARRVWHGLRRRRARGEEQEYEGGSCREDPLAVHAGR